MKKRFIFIPLAILISIASILVLACKHPFGAGIQLKKYGNDTVDTVDKVDKEKPLYPDSTKITVFTNQHIIPAITVTSNNTIIAAVGDRSTKGKILIKKSKDLGKTWEEVTVATDTDFSNSHVHPFFITAHNNDILLGLATTNKNNNKVTFHRSKDNGETWIKNNKSITASTGNDANAFVTYGNGVTLRHGRNGKFKLLFSYFYLESQNKASIYNIVSTDNGENWDSFGSKIGIFTGVTRGKALEIEDGSILYFLNGPNSTRQFAWAKSTDCGETFSSSQNHTNSPFTKDYPRAFDFCRYEFNGNDISEAQYVLATFSEKYTYKVMMSTDDFNKGVKGTKVLGDKAKELGKSTNDIYPAITVLKDGTICTLAAENVDIVFRRFNLAWLEQ
ncbi:exo-alpha-sialidase [Brachyspira aalborgi]|uniref:exo-alpha-sialidase n=1 Tax=Brachyspira aalborgi TaxID=29522 RepID=A0A5C8G6C6_9SPIR|nr:sialidase family protein [Brachyspira aalborgi]TXJ57249.1 exo-alpha-sialidase [Brachyspira aalborgi]